MKLFVTNIEILVLFHFFTFMMILFWYLIVFHIFWFLTFQLPFTYLGQIDLKVSNPRYQY